MSETATSPHFKENAHAALADSELQRSLEILETNFIGRRKLVADKLPEFDALRDAARDHPRDLSLGERQDRDQG